ncbi:MAG: hypothetical protein ACQERD_04735 [Campylobacterota bacterium]
MKNKKMSLAGVMLGAALTTTSAFAGSHGGCGSSKCGNETKKKVEKKGACGSSKCGADTKAQEKLKDKAKCGSDTKSKAQEKKATGACGSGKCG